MVSDGSAWTYQVLIDDEEVDNFDILRPMTITHGRSASITQPDAPQLEMTWLGATPLGSLGDLVQVNAEVTGGGLEWIYDAPDSYTYDSPLYVWDNVRTSSEPTVFPRFVGRIDSIAAVEASGDVEQWQVTCTGEQVRVGWLKSTLTRPAESDIDRVEAIAGEHDLTVNIVGASELQLAADVIERDALDALYQVCESSGGLLWQSPDGTLNYGTGDHRRRDALGPLPADSILDGLTWVQAVEEIVNHVTIRWGPEETPSELTVYDGPSVSTWGQRHVDVSTLCAASDDANILGALILGRRSQPFWLMPGVVCNVTQHATYTDKMLLASLDVGDIILIPADEAPAPTPGPFSPWVVEGWVEVAEPNMDTRIQLALADANRWATMHARTWAEAAEATWGEEAAGTWLEAVLVEEVTP